MIQETGPSSQDRTSYQYNSLNQLTAKEVCSYVSKITMIHDYGYTYDNRGNLVKEEEICSPTTQGPRNITIGTYLYDETDRMVQGANKTGEASLYTFNGLGVRVGSELILEDNTHGYTDFHCLTPSIETTVGGPQGPEVVKADYVIDYTRLNIDQRVLMKLEEGGYDFRYVYGLDKIQVTVNSEGSNWWGQNIKPCVMMNYVHTDRLGSVVNLSDQYGRVTARVDYDDWGKVTAYTDITVDGGFRRLLPEITYATHEYDDVLDMFYAKARMYDADNRRFVAVDQLKGNIFDSISMIQYLYVIDNPILLIDLLGLNPTNALLNIDWSKVIAKDGPADNVRGKEQYVKLKNVWNQLQNYYPNAGITTNGEYEACTISDGGKYLQIQIHSETGTAKMTTFVDNKSQSQSVSKIKIGDGYAISKNKLESYFRKVWCEEYHLSNVPLQDTRYILDSFAIALANTELLDIRAGEEEVLKEARKFIITGNATHRENYYVGIVMENSERLKQNELGMQKFVDGVGIVVSLAGVAGAVGPVAGFTVNAIISGSKKDYVGVLWGAGNFITGKAKVVYDVAANSKSIVEFVAPSGEIIAPENDYITLNIMSAGRANCLTFEVTPEGKLVNIFAKPNDEYRIGLEYRQYRNEYPPDLKYRYEIEPGKNTIGKDIKYDS